MKIGFFGTPLCSRRKYGKLETFSDLVRLNYNATLVAQPTGGGVQESQILEAVQATPEIDVAVIAHAEFEHMASGKTAHFDAMKQLDNLLVERGIVAVHLIKKEQADLAFKSGPVDYEIVKFKSTGKLRMARDPEDSDNGIDSYGNIVAAKAIIAMIDQALSK